MAFVLGKVRVKIESATETGPDALLPYCRAYRSPLIAERSSGQLVTKRQDQRSICNCFSYSNAYHHSAHNRLLHPHLLAWMASAAVLETVGMTMHSKMSFAGFAIAIRDLIRHNTCAIRRDARFGRMIMMTGNWT